MMLAEIGYIDDTRIKLSIKKMFHQYKIRDPKSKGSTIHITKKSYMIWSELFFQTFLLSVLRFPPPLRGIRRRLIVVGFILVPSGLFAKKLESTAALTPRFQKYDYLAAASPSKDFQHSPVYDRSNTSIYFSLSPAVAVNIYAEDNIWPGFSPDIRIGGDFRVFTKKSISLDLYGGYQFSLYFPPEGRLPYFLYKNGMISFQKISIGSAIRIWNDAFATKKSAFFFSAGQQLSFPFDMRIFDKFFSKRVGDFSLPYYSFKIGGGYMIPFFRRKLKPFFQEFELLLSPRNTGAHFELRFCVGVIVKEL